MGDRVVTAIQGKYYTAALQWDFVKKPQGYLGVFIGAKLLDGDFVLVSPGTSKRDVESGVGRAARARDLDALLLGAPLQRRRPSTRA